MRAGRGNTFRIEQRIMRNLFGEHIMKNLFGEHIMRNLFGEHIMKNLFGEHIMKDLFGEHSIKNLFEELIMNSLSSIWLSSLPTIGYLQYRGLHYQPTIPLSSLLIVVSNIHSLWVIYI